jgi:hypothetical protein
MEKFISAVIFWLFICLILQFISIPLPKYKYGEITTKYEDPIKPIIKNIFNKI